MWKYGSNYVAANAVFKAAVQNLTQVKNNNNNCHLSQTTNMIKIKSKQS